MLHECRVALLILSLSVAVRAQVTFEDHGDEVVLDNGLIRMVLVRDTASIRSLVKDEQELMAPPRREGRGEGYVQIYPTGGYRNPSIDRLDVRRADGLIDLAFIQQNDRLPFHMETHYVMRDGVSGFYGYIVLRYDHQHYLDYIVAHNARTDDPRRRLSADDPAYIEQINFCFFMDDRLFTLERVEDDRHRRARSKRDPGERVMDATFVEPDGRIYTKYDLVFHNEDHHVHGISGHGFGAWVMQGTGEHLNGGPTTQELSAEHAILLQHFCAGHFGSGRLTFSPAEDGWSKLAGPFLFYFNRGEDEAAMWWDARKTAEDFVNAAPYAWMQHALYAHQRGTVTGRLSITDGTDPAGALVLLAQPPDEHNPQWQRQGKGFFFWSRVREDGAFIIEKVRPDTYTAYVLHDQQFGELRHDGVTVRAHETTDVNLTWTPDAIGRTVWQIGRPDRDAAEFMLGRGKSWGKWRAYRLFFPEDVDFRIGESDAARDWCYVHTVALDHAGEPYVPTWTVRFDLPAGPRGRAALRMGIAGVRGVPDCGVAVSVNGQIVGEPRFLNDSAPTRSASRGWYREALLPFDAALLRRGENVLTLELRPTTTAIRESSYGKVPSGMLMYDALRLELDESAPADETGE